MVANNSFSRKLLHSAVLAGTAALFGGLAHAQEGSGAGQETRTLEEVVVTARRKEESAQEIPVSVTALDSNAIYRQNIAEIDDLTSIVPGVNFTASGGANNTVFSVRGRSRGVFGNALPAVTTYVNEVPLSTWGGNIPSYDMASLQVLKGPQGTLFGRNSTAGAVLVSTQAPDHEFGGYVLAKIGEYNSQVFEGAVNIPIVKDKVAMRIAGQLDDRDGFTDDMVHPNEDDYGNHNRDNWRVSLLIEPFENFSNLTVYEKNKTDERAVPIIPVGYVDDPSTAIANVPYYNGEPFPTGFLVDPSAPLGIVPCGGDPLCDIRVQVARQDAAGVRKSWADLAGFLDQELESWSNTTTWDLGGVTIKNIFGYREVYTHSLSDIDGTQFPMIHADNVVNNKQYTNELQLSGSALDGALQYIGGLFWLKSEPNGGNRLALQLFAQSGTPLDSTFPAPFNGASGPADLYSDTSKAVFGQINYDLSRLSDSLAGLSVDIGARHTKDESENCPVSATTYSDPLPTESDCSQQVSEDFSKTTYNLGLNYQFNDDVLLYFVTRTGYRAGGVNSPILGGELMPYQSYEPEDVQDYELGLKSDWNVGSVFGRFNLALFRSEYDGVHYANNTSGASSLLGAAGVDNDFDPSNEPTGGLFYDNVGDATVQGVEVELVVQLMAGLQLSFAGSYLDKELDLSIELPPSWQAYPFLQPAQKDVESFVFLAAPDWSYTVGVDYTLPLDSDLGEVVLSANYFRISDINYGANVDAPSYETTDLRVDWFKLMSSDFDAAIYVSNVFDKEAILGPSSSSPGIGIHSAIYNEPRMWGASLRYSF